MTDDSGTIHALGLSDCEIEYTDHGAGEPILLVHAGVFSDWFLPMAKSPILEGLRIIRVCRAGYGSNPPKRPLTIEDHASHLAALADRGGLAACHVVGHSSGSLIAMQLASDHPELVRSLVLIEPAPCGPLQAEAFAELGRRFVGPALEAFAAGNLESAFDSFMRGVCGDRYREALVRGLGRAGYERAVLQSRYFFGDEVPAAVKWEFGPAAASRIQQPVLILEGNESRANGPLSQQVTELTRALLPQAEAAVIEGGNHALPLQNPDGVARAVTEFVRRHSTPSVSRRRLFAAAFTGAAGTKRRAASIEAKPQAVNIDLGETAVLVVDMQNDFASKGGLIDRLGFDIGPIRATVPRISAVLACARQARLKIVYLKMGFRPDLSDLGSADSPNRLGHLAAGVGQTIRAPNGAASRILVRDTWNTEIVPELKPGPADAVIYKNRYSGFYNTELDAILKRHRVRNLIVTGCTTSICVESTVRDAMFRDYRCVVLRDCVAEVIGNDNARSNHEASLLVIETRFGWVTDSGQFLKSLKAI